MKFNTSFKIDSFKLRIPKVDLNTIGVPTLNAELITVYADTGEIVDIKEIKDIGIKEKLTSLKLTNDNSITSVAIAVEVIKTNRLNEYITLKITSKLLKERYYEGITNQTINDIVSYLNSVGVALNYSQLVNSEVTDIDICKDVIISPNDYKGIIDRIKNNAIPTKQINKGYNIFNQKDNKGIEFSSRRKATPSNPYLKIYNKFLDSKSQLRNNHSIFFDHYQLETNQNLHRIEITLKNKKHFGKFNLGNTLDTFLNLTQKEIEVIFNDITSIHLKKEKCKKMELRKQQNIYKILYELILRQAEIIGITPNQTKQTILDAIDKRTSKDNHNRLIDEAESEMKNTSKTYANNRRIDEIMERLCIL